MKRPLKLQIGLLLAIGLFATHRYYFRAPTEAQMLAKFHQHRSRFEQIRLMLKQDKSIGSISRYGALGRNYQSLPQPIPSQARMELYKARLQALGFSTVYAKDDRIWTTVFGGGFTDTSWGIGYAWLKEPPEALVKSAYSEMPMRDKRHYSRIEGNWYIFHYR